MATTQAQLKTVTDAPANDQQDDIDLNALVAQTTSNTDALPDWDVHNAACKATRDTLERVTTGAI
ncbi:hypothetical protein [Natrarchaeobaculum sulfurireducens]|uniref:Uncharacterized protein n=1 Tax=Natrarchaeobaculum sulfurireducens TaxID=2044521 RepID=A0A346PN81_9EURY|nr:hypothetical protein [Natrarchaeobaculum sulfurireducens]AXR80976.1 hypothetical protein AArcMg_0958 [Natrarchaeobaculum sulfurireducens]